MDKIKTSNKWFGIKSQPRTKFVGPTDPAGVFTAFSDEDSIRLLELQPGEGTDPLVVDLRIISIDSPPEYRAVSYVWGDKGANSCIKCNDTDFDITDSLHGALERVRDPTKPLLLWADAVCIDQRNTSERNHQVALMGAIFNKAAEVYVYLGPDEEGIAPRIAYLISGVTSKIKEEAVRNGGFKDLPRLHARQDYDTFLEYDWTALATMLRLPWFRRVWVWQEVGLARKATILIGNERIDWQEMMDIFTWLVRKAVVIAERHKITGIHTTLRNWVYFDKESRNENFNVDLFDNSPTQCFYQIIDGAAICAATDDRDHIYAFLGHPGARTASGELIIKPDYDLSMNQTFVRFAVAWLKNRKHAYMLASVAHTTGPDEPGETGLPTWIPTWHKPATMWQLHSHESYHRFNASRSTVFEPEFFNNDMRMKVKGIIIDTATQCFAALSRNGFTSSPKECGHRAWIVDVLESVFSGVRLWPRRYTDILSAVASVFGQRSQSEATRRPDFAAYILKHPQLCKTLTIEELANVTEADARDGDGERFVHQGRYFCHSRRIFFTKSGHLGLGPRGMKEGDICAIFHGAEVPYVIRPLPSGIYLFVGECYVCEMMDGEAIDLAASGDLNEDAFFID